MKSGIVTSGDYSFFFLSDFACLIAALAQISPILPHCLKTLKKHPQNFSPPAGACGAFFSAQCSISYFVIRIWARPMDWARRVIHLISLRSGALSMLVSLLTAFRLFSRSCAWLLAFSGACGARKCKKSQIQEERLRRSDLPHLCSDLPHFSAAARQEKKNYRWDATYKRTYSQ